MSNLDNQSHEGFTRMLFVDGIVGVGFPNAAIGVNAEKGGLASLIGPQGDRWWVWNRSVLEDLGQETLQNLYVSLKMYEVTHAS